MFESTAPEHFLARCSRKGVTNSGICLLERRIGDADITFRFPRDWLSDWQNVATGIDRLMRDCIRLTDARTRMAGNMPATNWKIAFLSPPDHVEDRQFENIGAPAFLDFEKQDAQ